MSWYVLMTKPQQERRAEENLTSQGYTTYLPLVNCLKISRGKKITREEPLFFRYLFVQLDLQKDSTGAIRYTRGVSDFIRFGDQFGIVSNELVEFLKQRCDTGGEVRSRLPKKGEEVEILDGPYKYINAVYDNPDGEQRSYVLVTLLQNTVRLSLDNTSFKKAV